MEVERRIAEARRTVEEKTSPYAPFSHLNAYLQIIHLAGGTDVGYETLLTSSCIGTTFYYHPKDNTGLYLFLPGEDDRIGRATGYFFQRVRDRDEPERTWELVTQEVDVGRAVQAEVGERVIFAGYRDAEKPADREVLVAGWLFAGGQEWLSWEKFSRSRRDGDPSLGRLDRTAAPATDRELLTEIISKMATWAEEDPRAKNNWLQSLCEERGLPPGSWGLEGIEAFAVDLASDQMTEDDFGSGWRSCHAINPQISSRLAVAVWLGKMSETALVPRPLCDQLVQVAKDYRQAHQSWSEFKRVASQKDAWSSHGDRGLMSAAVRQALAHEREATAELKRAAETMRQKPIQATPDGAPDR